MKNEKEISSKLPKPETTRYKSWEDFVKSVHKSIGRQLSSGVISFKHVETKSKNR